MANITEVIKYEGNNSTFVWKHPSEDFNSLTQLIVHESQEAIFMMNGQALDLFGPGRYTLETQNIPLIGKIINRVTGDTSPFHCEVYFINKAVQMAIKWGTDSKVQFMEPTYQFPMAIGACGEMSLRAEDSRKLLVKLVGTESVLGQEQITKYFKAFLMSKIKPCLAQTIREQSISIFELDEHLEELSQTLHQKLAPDFVEYGVVLEHFFVTTIMRPEGEAAYERFKTLHFRQYADIAEAKLNQQVDIINKQTEAQKIIIESQAMAQKRAQEGYTYAQERSFDVAEITASNENIGQFTNMGIGLGTMAGVGGAIGGIFKNALAGVNDTTVPQMPEEANLQSANEQSSNLAEKPQQSVQNNISDAVQPQAETVICAQCNKPIPKNFKFCPECGAKVETIKTICPKCGNDVKGFKFCPECGEKL